MHLFPFILFLNLLLICVPVTKISDEKISSAIFLLFKINSVRMKEKSLFYKKYNLVLCNIIAFFMHFNNSLTHFFLTFHYVILINTHA